MFDRADPTAARLNIYNGYLQCEMGGAGVVFYKRLTIPLAKTYYLLETKTWFYPKALPHMVYKHPALECRDKSD
jgi:hypothetical protein